jgi:hypothetical protein
LNVVGYALGGLMMFMMTLMVTTGFCMPSALYGRLFGRWVRAVERVHQ